MSWCASKLVLPRLLAMTASFIGVMLVCLHVNPDDSTVAVQRYISSAEFDDGPADSDTFIVEEKLTFETELTKTTSTVDESIDDYIEKLLSSTSSLLDIDTAGSPLNSSVTVLNPKRKYVTGESVRVRVDIRDGKGRQLARGGDDIRVTLEGDGGALSGHVVDLNNGSYLADLPLLWPGEPKVKVALAKNFEIYRAFYQSRNVLKTTLPMLGRFSNELNQSEHTFCSPFSDFTLFRNKKLCNLTSENSDLDWYCVKPTNTMIKCSQLTYLSDTYAEGVKIRKTPAEEELEALQKTNKNPTHAVRPRFIDNTIELSVTFDNASNTKQVTPSSHREMLHSSWTGRAPLGHFMDRKWYPIYSQRKDFNQTGLLSFFQNTTVLLLGDSNCRMMFIDIAAKTGCDINTADGTVPKSYERPLECVHAPSGFKMHWNHHAYPFHPGSGLTELSDGKAPHKTIDDIPSSGRFVVCVHLYAHFAFHHHSVFVKHLTAVRDSILRALERNPGIQFVIRGPHMDISRRPAILGGDTAAPLLTVITKRLFRGLYDRVAFLQPWDMTVAVWNSNVHPEDWVTGEINEVFLSYLI